VSLLRVRVEEAEGEGAGFSLPVCGFVRTVDEVAVVLRQVGFQGDEGERPEGGVAGGWRVTPTNGAKRVEEVEGERPAVAVVLRQVEFEDNEGERPEGGIADAHTAAAYTAAVSPAGVPAVTATALDTTTLDPTSIAAVGLTLPATGLRVTPTNDARPRRSLPPKTTAALALSHRRRRTLLAWRRGGANLASASLASTKRLRAAVGFQLQWALLRWSRWANWAKVGKRMWALLSKWRGVRALLASLWRQSETREEADRARCHWRRRRLLAVRRRTADAAAGDELAAAAAQFAVAFALRR